MNKSNFTKVVKNIRFGIAKHSPEILTGVGIAGMITTTILAVKATPKALKLLEEEAREKDIPKEDLTIKEKIKTTWKCYIPAAVTCTTSVACLIGASSVNAKRIAAIATAYNLSETALNEYREKVVETIGEKKEKLVRDKVAEKHISDRPVNNTEIIMTEKGNTLCFDPISGRYFKSDMDKIKKAKNDINWRLLNDMYVSLNEFYDELGLAPTSLGDELGWVVDKGKIDIYFSSQLTDEGEPCLVMEYSIAPKYDYNKLY